MPKAKLYNGTSFLAEVDYSLEPETNPTEGTMVVPPGKMTNLPRNLTLVLDPDTQYKIHWHAILMGPRDTVDFKIAAP